jgi:tight adherence protein C
MYLSPVTLIVGIVFLATFLGLTGALLYLNRTPKKLDSRLRSVGSGSASSMAGDHSASGRGAPLFVVDPGSYSNLRARLARAGLRGVHADFWYNLARVILMVLFGSSAYVVADFFSWSVAIRWLSVAGAAVVGSALLSLWLTDRISRKQSAIREAIPNVLDLIIVCVEAGLSLNAAVQRISQEMKVTYPDLSRELAILNQEIFLGKSRGEAFRDLARRTGVDELRSLATVLMQSDRMGTSIADVLRVQAQNIRTKRRQRALEATHKMPVKLVFPLVLLIFPEMMVVLLGPAGIHLLRTLTETAAGR